MPTEKQPNKGEDQDSFTNSGMVLVVEDFSVENEEDSMMFLNSEDGLTSVNVAGGEDDDDISVNVNATLEREREREREQLQLRLLEAGLSLEDVSIVDLINDDEEFPKNIIVTGFHSDFFEDLALRERFERLFLAYGKDAAFHYFRSFKRVRVTYSSAACAIEAKIKMHMSSFAGGDDGEIVLKCYFGQPTLKRSTGDGYLHPPTPQRQYLISPPASPPPGWEQMLEAQPSINYDHLVKAITNLVPGETHELHKPEKESHPSIVVHVADDEMDDSEELDEMQEKVKIIHTRRPDIQAY